MGIRLLAGERGVCIGQSGCGKSTLSTNLIRSFLTDYPKGRVVIVDTKPRYRATHKVNGLPMTYQKWAKGDVIAQSVAIHSAGELAQAFRFTRCVILQSLYENGEDVDDYEEQAAAAARTLFRSSHASSPTLFYIDEYYDLLGGGLVAIADRRVLRTIRAGRERFMTVLISSQRPRSIPLPTLTEATKYYIFNLEYEEDVKYMRKHGPQLTLTPSGYKFVFYERHRGGQRDEKLMQLNLKEAA